MYACKSCGNSTPKSYSGMCQSCYRYFRDGGKVYALPERGRIMRDERGRVVCHICGRAFTRLGSHVRERHTMTIEEYKEAYGLCANARTTEASYSHVMREHALANDMDKQLSTKGTNTRIKKGETHFRRGKQVRPQEVLDKRARRKAPTEEGRP